MAKKELPKHLTKGGPGDESQPGDVNTEAWWNKLSKKGAERFNKPGSIASQAKNKDTWFCTIPFTQIYSELDGQYQACCFGAPSGTHIDDVSLKDWMIDSEYMNDLRTEMLDPNSKHEKVNQHCTRCRTDEDKYGRSRRTNCLKIHTNDPTFWDAIERNVELYKSSGVYDFDERIIEVQLKIYGSECNLDCHMCMHANSTTRLRSAKAGVFNTEVFDILEDHKIKEVMRDKTKGVVEQILELAPYIRSIKIIGGEPLIMKKHYEMLDALIETGHAKYIRLKYQTNFTKTKAGKHSIFRYLPEFEHVSMVASVDGIGKSIEYMRRKTDWEEVVQNIEICGSYPNVVVDFNGLVSFLSVLRFYEVVDWCKENPVIDQLNWAMCEKPEHLNPCNLPQKLKDELIPKYKEWPDIQAALMRDPDPDVNIQDTFDYLLKQDLLYKGSKYEMHLFDVFPELEEYYIPTTHELKPLDLVTTVEQHYYMSQDPAYKFIPVENID